MVVGFPTMDDGYLPGDRKMADLINIKGALNNLDTMFNSLVMSIIFIL